MINRSQRKSLSILLTLALVVNLFLPFVSQQVKAATVATDLFISEYIEGGNNNKAIELFNGTGHDVNLKEYKLELYSNGSNSPSNPLDFSKLTDTEATLANGETFVIVNGGSAPDLLSKGNLEHTITYFNGDDAIVLTHNGEIIDSLGQVGTDPGTSWGATDVKTVDQTLVRKSTVTAGDKDPSDAFDPATEWDSLGKDVFTAIGSHTMDGFSAVPTKVSSVSASVTAPAVKAGTEVALTTSTDGATIYYTLDDTEPTTESTLYSAPIVINADTTIKAFAVSSDLENSDVATFSYTVLQHKTIAEVRELNIDDYVLTTGIVTGIVSGTVYIQDESAGIGVRGYDLGVKPGDEIQVYGQIGEFNSFFQINAQAADVEVLGQKEIPAAKEVTAVDLSEQYEGMLVKVGKSVVESYSGGNYTVVDVNGDSYQVRLTEQEWLELETSYESITGVLGSYKDTYQLMPRSLSDIVHDPSFVRAVVATPGEGFINLGESVTLTSNTEGATIHYTTDGSEPTTSSSVYSAPIVINADTTIKAFAVKEGLTSSKVYTFDFIIQKDVVRTFDIQGEGHFSKYEGLNVNDVEGVVTYVLGKNDVYIQDLEGDGNDATSDGILVYKSGHGLVPGDVVKVSGQVKEHFIEGYDDRYQVDLPSTEIAASTVEKIRSGEALPTPINIGKDRTAPTDVIDNDRLTKFDPEEDAIDFYESLEGMLVQVDDAKVVAPQKYGEVVVIPGTMEANTPAGGMRISEGDFNPERITIDMNDNYFKAKMGDQFNGSITGVMSYGYSNYKVLTKKTSLPALVEGSNTREITSIVPAEGKLTVASYNVENFSPKVDPAKVTKLAQAIVTNLKKPDIVGLTEVQDNDGPTDSGTTDGYESAKLLIDTIASLGGPTYAYTEIAPEDKTDGGQPGGNIRVGFLYNPERVELMDAPKGTADQAVGFENGKLTLNPGRIDPTNPAFEDSRKSLAAQFKFQGKSVIVVANHFNSKGGDQPLFGKNQPPVLKSEVQRMEIAKIVNGFVQDVKAKDPNANVILLGDFNDFEWSNPLETLKGNELVNMVEKVPADQRYSYSYQGNAQVLDHILVTKNMEAATTVNMVHINSGFMEEHGRASDHDPLLIQTDLKAIEKVYNKVYNLTGFKTKKLVVGTTNSLINVDATSVITDGIWLKKSADVKGAGLATTLVAISPAQRGAIIELSGETVKEVFIDNANVTEIHGAENVQSWDVKDGVDTSNIKFYDSEGNLLESPFQMALAS